MDALSRQIDDGDGTPEAPWRAWLQAQALPHVTAQALVGPGQRAVVVAPHPDDEVLMVGGLLAELAVAGRAMELVAVTDGEASHPGSTRWSREHLAHERARETRAALAALGCKTAVTRLRIPDGQVAAHAEPLAERLRAVLRPGDVVFTTWTLDGHPDHEATGHATRSAAAKSGARVFEVPVWGWHWALPGAASMPWTDARLVPLSPRAVQRKYAALQCFATQWDSDQSCAQAPVLRATTLQRAQRPFEVVFA